MDEPMDPRERIEDLLEEARVRWFMLDPQVKQAVVLGGVYFLVTLLDVAATVAKMRAAREG